ncbi:hypothetical protein FBY41_1735 [Humibacillus xanthopallidus]|uniref:Swt1-like HEPN domain-containing protein n=2 Tax=Humibacillus xanthopallidus TaxID=412689 RepID=A0A543HTU7_9MICO|nr:hypothetical protein FBY41_1735 [Humibacillus xanthopallidus]
MAALESAEQALRLLVLEVLGPDWLDAPGAPPRGKLESIRASESRARPGVSISDNLVDFTFTKPLIEMLRANPEKFAEVFPNVEQSLSFLQFVADVRNTVAHARPLYAHERALLEGISGMIRSALADYRMAKSPAAQHYATIESIVDHFGVAGCMADIVPENRHRLAVGDILTFDCKAWDGRGREIEWMVATTDFPPFARVSDWMPQARGTNVSLQYEVGLDDVGESTHVYIAMRSTGRFHLVKEGAGVDGLRFFTYAVNPPLDD